MSSLKKYRSDTDITGSVEPLKRSLSDCSLLSKQSNSTTLTSKEKASSKPAEPTLTHAVSANSAPLEVRRKERLAFLQNTEETPGSVIREWFPNLLHCTCFMPQIFTNRTSNEKLEVFGETANNPLATVVTEGQKGKKETLFDSDVRDDNAQQHVLHCLRKISEVQDEVMFVLSQLSYRVHLNELCFSATADTSHRPEELKRDSTRGDFDILIIHRNYGFLIGEIKSFGARSSEWSAKQFEEKLLSMLSKMMRLDKKSPDAIGQLQKARKVLEHLNMHRLRMPRVSVTLILPHVSRGQLRQALENDPRVKKALCKELGVPEEEDPVDVCLCADQMSRHMTPWEFPEPVIKQLNKWWHSCLSHRGCDPAMNDNEYEDIVASFAGPGSVVQAFTKTKPFRQIRTLGQSVADVSEKLTDFALYPSQVDVLHQADDLVFLTGPPGTGKTLMLVLMAVGWLRKTTTEPVYIVSLRNESYAVSVLIHWQIVKTTEKVVDKYACSRVHFIDLTAIEFHKNPTEAAEKLAAYSSSDGNLNIIADELDVGESLAPFITALKENPAVKRLRLWAACVKKPKTPKCMKEFVLQNPLRNPPCVVREIQKSNAIIKGDAHPYKMPGECSALDSPGEITYSGTVSAQSCQAGEKRPSGENLQTFTSAKDTSSSGPIRTEKQVNAASDRERKRTSSCLVYLPYSDGPPILKLRHVMGQDGHQGRFTVNCRRCGDIAGKILTEQLHIGKEVPVALGDEASMPESFETAAASAGRAEDQQGLTSTSVPIAYKDVLVLTFFNPDPDCRVLQGLRQYVPVRVVPDNERTDIASVAVMEGQDEVVVTSVKNILGLERKVVVWVGGHDEGDDYEGRLTAISRCTGQLLWICR